MPLTYRRPGVYLQESLLNTPSNSTSAATVACFVGAAGKGPANEPYRVESWSDYVRVFGEFESLTNPNATPKVLSYLPFSVWSFFQNGGRTAWIIRSIGDGDGTASTVSVNGQDVDGDPLTSFALSAISEGTWGDSLKYSLSLLVDEDGESVFGIDVILTNSAGVDEVVETFGSLSVSGDIAGTRRVDAAINDSAAGSQYIRVSSVNELQPQPEVTSTPVSLAGGVDPDIPSSSDITTSAALTSKIDGPVTLNLVGYLLDASTSETASAPGSFIGASVPGTSFPDRYDIFIVDDNCPPRAPNVPSSAYKGVMTGSLGNVNNGDSFTASYGPWIVIPHPRRANTVVSVPPGGAVIGMMNRIDATIGAFRAPAGVIASLTNVVGSATKFTETEQGDLNDAGVNVIRSVTGAGICVMGARTRKSYGDDRYVNARRTLIYVTEVLRRSTQFAVFENNDQRLWSSLRVAGDRVLRPLWEAGGLKGASADEAFYVKCDESNNPSSAVQAGEVVLEVGVALQKPAEFVIVRITQYDRGATTSIEVNPQ